MIQNKKNPLFFCFLLITLVFAPLSLCFAAEQDLPKELKGVEVKQNLGKMIDLSLTFQDHNGKTRQLKEFFGDGKPVILTLNYYKCPMLCSLQLNGLTSGLNNLQKKLGFQFRIVTISINPKEGPTLAKEKRENYLKQIPNLKVDWDFFVGKKENIDKISKALGFGFKYIPKTKEYAHKAVIFFLSPKGKIVQYLHGIQYPARDIKFALMTASQGKIGTIIDKIFMSCFVYDPETGKYKQFAYGMIRLGGLLTMIFLGAFLGIFWFREHQRQPQHSGEST